MSAPLGIIAGLGDLPVSLAEAARADGRPVYILRLDGFVEPRLAEYPGETVGLGEPGRAVRLLKAAGCEELVFAGIVRRPEFGKLRPDWSGARLLPKVLKAARKGDDALLRVILTYFEQQGLRIVGAHDIQKSLLAPHGVIAGPAPADNARADMEAAMFIAGEMGRLDIGQGAVVCDGLVLAVEAQEGTDAMLARCARLDPALRGTARKRRGVLAKRSKPIQERKVDLPTIGPATLRGADAAGLSGIVVEAGGVLVLDREELVMEAEARGMFLFGMPAPDEGEPG